jgi:hypothetical protein
LLEVRLRLRERRAATLPPLCDDERPVRFFEQYGLCLRVLLWLLFHEHLFDERLHILRDLALQDFLLRERAIL